MGPAPPQQIADYLANFAEDQYPMSKEFSRALEEEWDLENSPSIKEDTTRLDDWVYSIFWDIY